MTTPINDGGPAFPVAPEHNGYPRDAHGPGYGTGTGMSLRDYFASSSLQGLLSNPENSRFSANVIAALAYSIADSMLEARDRKKG